MMKVQNNIYSHYLNTNVCFKASDFDIYDSAVGKKVSPASAAVVAALIMLLI